MAQATIVKKEKAEIVKKYGGSQGSTGLPQVQIALLTHRINSLNQHFKDHKLDHHSRLGLLKMVGQRKRMLDYLRDRDANAYLKLIGDLGLRK